jgi:hypothetical protein
MNIEETVIDNLRKLPVEKQREVLDFSQSLMPTTSLLTPDPNLTSHEKAEKWRKVIAKLPRISTNLPDEALHCDTIYEDE